MGNSNRSITVWTAINSIAVVIALLFSSLIPHLQSLIKGEKITIEPIKSCSISHDLGNIQLNIPIYIQNNGGRNSTIKSIICSIKGPDENYYELKAQTFDQPSQYFPGNQTNAMKPITLSPNAYWSENVSFYKDYSEFEQQESEEIYDEMLNNFKAKSEIPIPNFDKPTFDKPTFGKPTVGKLTYSTGYYIVPRPEIDDKIIQKVKAYFNRKFSLKTGNFRMAITCLSEQNNIL